MVTPLAAKKDAVSWPEAKAFARDLCTRMAADHPDRYLITMTKKDRGGRIYLDYLRNDFVSSAVAPLSPRAREGAPVSMPLSMDAGASRPRSEALHVRTAPALIAKSIGVEGLLRFRAAAEIGDRAIALITKIEARSYTWALVSCAGGRPFFVAIEDSCRQARTF